MHSQLYLSGRLTSKPEVATTKKGKPWTRLLLETEFVREPRRGEYQTETVILPVNCFAREAELVRTLQPGEALTIGAHLYGAKFQNSDGTVKYGVQVVADEVFTSRRETSRPLNSELKNQPAAMQ